ncbi:hypothetical protein COLO4_12210 [Corchorus olitorius]|uniref:Uncharacterized protein n=1 Tax=Corchorus olitorius TaxID=93759 RepID=A0A1R3K1Z4_9ROSI|nr:hypothetical protein COLO4_12210 [Corchorus olitorius]
MGQGRTKNQKPPPPPPDPIAVRKWTGLSDP